MLMLSMLIVPFLGAFAVYLNEKKKDLIAIGFGVCEFILALILFITVKGGNVTFNLPGFAILGLDLAADGFRALYLLIACFMWMICVIFSKEYMEEEHKVQRYYFFTMLTLMATVGVLISDSLYTTFIFFEIMSLTSYTWVAQEEKKGALRAGDTYLAVAVIGGLVMLMGLAMFYNMTGSLKFSDLLNLASTYSGNPAKLKEVYIAGLLVLFGFGAKAGMFPLHIWLPKAHPVAPSPASALLSGMLTKAGIFGILVLSAYVFKGQEEWGIIIILLGTITMFLGAFIALFSTNLKRTLACSSMSQIGFILIGVGASNLIGEEASLALSGSVYHMMNHSLIKLVLFTLAGIVIVNAHTLELSELRGFGKNKPLFHIAFLLGALGIGGIPLFNGYISKTMLHESIVAWIHEGGPSYAHAIEWIFLLSGGMTLAYMFKLYRTLFLEKPVREEYKEKKRYMTNATGIAVMVSAFILPCLGLLSKLVLEHLVGPAMEFMNLEAFEETIHFFNLENLKGAAISIAFSVVIYLLIVMPMKYNNVWPAWLDLENLVYRPLILKLLPFLGALVCRIFDKIVDSLIYILRISILRPRREHRHGAARRIYVFGKIFDSIELFIGRLLKKDYKTEDDLNIEFTHWFAERSHDIVRFDMIVEHSISFGLMLFSTGLVVTLLYLLLS